MGHHHVSVSHFVLEKLLVHIVKWADVQEPFVDVRLVPTDSGWIELRRLWMRPAEAVEKVERIDQKESAVVVEVVADEPVRDRRLRRSSLDSRVGIDNGRRCIETWIRDSPDSHPPV